MNTSPKAQRGTESAQMSLGKSDIQRAKILVTEIGQSSCGSKLIHFMILFVTINNIVFFSIFFVKDPCQDILTIFQYTKLIHFSLQGLFQYPLRTLDTAFLVHLNP